MSLPSEIQTHVDNACRRLDELARQWDRFDQLTGAINEHADAPAAEDVAPAYAAYRRLLRLGVRFSPEFTEFMQSLRTLLIKVDADGHSDRSDEEEGPDGDEDASDDVEGPDDDDDAADEPDEDGMA